MNQRKWVVTGYTHDARKHRLAGGDDERALEVSLLYADQPEATSIPADSLPADARRAIREWVGTGAGDPMTVFTWGLVIVIITALIIGIIALGTWVL